MNPQEKERHQRSVPALIRQELAHQKRRQRQHQQQRDDIGRGVHPRVHVEERPVIGRDIELLRPALGEVARPIDEIVGGHERDRQCHRAVFPDHEGIGLVGVISGEDGDRRPRAAKLAQYAVDLETHAQIGQRKGDAHQPTLP
jgi:hypothetical protein